jgi:transcriptional regulator with XRE-family HTH domain
MEIVAFFCLQSVNSALASFSMSGTKPTKAPERFIRLIKKAMDGHPDKLSLNELARRADLSPAYLSFLLNGLRGVPSNGAIARLEQELQIPDGELFKAAGKPDDAALGFFRKEEAGSIMRTLASAPRHKLPQIHRLIERFLQKGRSAGK